MSKILTKFYLNRMDNKDLFTVTVDWYSMEAYFLTNEVHAKQIIYTKNNKLCYF
jgi:hypothetical protein